MLSAMSSPNSISPRRLRPRKTRRTTSLPVDLLRNESLLPLDLLRNVLSRLPTLSLLQLRSVCKEWREIIDDLHFAAMQATSGAESPRILLISGPRLAPDPQFAVDDEFLVTSLPRLATRPRLDGPGASCHGLVCFEDLSCGMTYIVNPLTREALSWHTAERWRWKRIGIGIGADRLTGRYKIVRVSVFCSREPAFRPLRAEVLDQGSRSWRDIASVPSSRDLHEGPVFAAGSIHWKIGGRGRVLRTGPMIRICSFDLTKEEFAWTPCPELHEAHLVDLQGVLGLVDCSVGKSVDVWVMEESGRWMKEYTVRPPFSLSNHLSYNFLGCGRRKIVLIDSGSIWIRDPVTGELKDVPRPSGRRARAARSITVSLLSPSKLWSLE
ncbi:hypothetical protein BT93_A1665 [Corymbia citriodora subsp. variegata]|nr:hypothetical protein BT93_A1665 [Corymbia citriodora subsp. variegata]